ncbi:FAD-dependent monooxygenase [Rubellimicrobium roseum]|uniref:FAD-binding domain-containing protein n=1 Tax=Rubellimicrobium roseum TaxID=687525 RepID=A0A5C4NAM0_9RHOB|nr:FAD-dependent monooxygenase [Rubellimicrobium roseum]TNC64915.1 hypothetical protein FHG71_18300 [Rubellimicrobium roseum]
MRERDASVLVVGAGPTGLVLALVLARMGVAVRIVDRKPGPSRESRALGVRARTLELYRALGLSDRVVAAGLLMKAGEVWVEGQPRAVLPLGRMGQGISPFPYLLIYPQDAHKPMLISALAEVGVEVDWHTSLLGFTPDAEGVTASLERDEQPEVIRTDWLVGADGGRSTVREGLGIAFEGGTAEGLFYVADVQAHRLGGTAVLGFGTHRFAVLFPLPEGRARLIGMVPLGSEADGHIDYEDVAPDARCLTGLEAPEVAWFSTYHVRHRVAAQFRHGRCFLAGDAGHVHSPLGGQGMNTGIGDALNLAWKLGAVVRGEASAAILDSYEPERLPFARRLVATTDAAFLRVADDSWVGRTTRTRVMPAVLALVSRLGVLGPLMFRTISQTRISYRDSPLSDGRWGRLAAGDRLPWLKSQDNHAVLNFTWQVHVHGEAGPEIRAWAEARGLPLHVWPWDAEAHAAGLRRDGAVLVRPDGHIGCLSNRTAAAAVEAYAKQRELSFKSVSNRASPS